MTSSTRIAFVANPSESRETLLRCLVRHGNVEVEGFLSIDELRRNSRGRDYSGIVVDLKTLASIDEGEKPFVEELARSFPLLRVRPVGEPALISGLVDGRPMSGEALLSAFLDGACRKARPRGVRAEERKCLVLSVVAREAPGAQGIRCSVSNVSRGGFFVVTAEEWRSERMLLEIQDLADRRPIGCQIRWRLPWGASRRSLPGFGVAIDSIEPGQRDEIERLLGEAVPAVL